MEKSKNLELLSSKEPLWNDGTCMSSIKTKDKTKNIRCKRSVCKDSDFCRYHKRFHNYHKPLLTKISKNSAKIQKLEKRDINNKIETIHSKIIAYELKTALKERHKKLDENYKHNLIGLYETWEEVPLKYQIKIDDQWWDIRMLLNHFTQQLNNSNMENPYPIYPSNPFNRILFNKFNILTIQERVKKLKIPINIALKTFLNLDKVNLEKCYKKCLNSNDGFSTFLNSQLQNKLRFKLIKSKDSQNNFIGYWVLKKEKRSFFEDLYREWEDVPYQIYDPFFDQIIDNNYKDYLYILLDTVESESFGFDNDPTLSVL